MLEKTSGPHSKGLVEVMVEKSYYLVTVKYPRRADHDPRNKVTGDCPANPGKTCTDVTGEHHTILCKSESILDARAPLEAQGIHVTRIEEVFTGDSTEASQRLGEQASVSL